jgi:hypothetical protein
MHNVVIGIPTIGTLNWRFAADLMALQMPGNVRVIWQVRSMIATARNSIVEKALEEKETTHVFMIDDDMTFKPDILLRMLEHNVDIIGALAFKRTDTFAPCTYLGRNGKLYPIIPESMMKVTAVGSAGLLVKREVYEKVPYPWFETYYNEEKRLTSVDIDFCNKARKAGFDIYVDPALEMGHIGEPPVITRKQFLEKNHGNIKLHSDIVRDNNDGEIWTGSTS